MKRFLSFLPFALMGVCIFSPLGGIKAQQAKRPIRYWTFDGNDYLKDNLKDSKLDIYRYKAKVNKVAGTTRNGLELVGSSGILLTSVLNQTGASALAVEFCFKGSEFQYQSFATPHFMIRLNYPYLQFKTTTIKGKTEKADNWMIMLKEIGKKSYDYYTDDNWHHLVFMVDAKKGIKQIYVDGELPAGFTRNIEKGDKLKFDGGDGFRTISTLDELAFYVEFLPAAQIARHAQDALGGRSYSFSTSYTPASTAARKEGQSYDANEFAPGYPDYTVQATDQLKNFPDPRFSSIPMKRNFPWLDITYLHRELPGKGGKGFGKLNPAKAVELTDEMAERWNYYIELPCLRQDSVTVNRTYADPSSVPHALIEYARKNPTIPTATVIMQIQGRPVHAGFDKQRAYAIAQDLPNNYYLRDGAGKVIVESKKKWFSPLAPLDYIKKDAQTTVFYLRQLTRHLGKPVDMLNDNGEIFGHIRSQSLLQRDPAVKKDIAQRKLSIPKYNGWFQNRLDTCYKNEILRTLGWKNTFFTFYNVSAYNDEYWPAYDMRRTTNTVMNGNHYSTPAFYPSRPDNWRSATAQLNGYGAIAQGRLREIKMGDKLFAPFVSAGWGFEEINIRPAQWLALSKSMVMLGAEFFHVGYFNVTGSTGWPNGVGPNDPRGYIYQVAMPVYAQAIGSRYYDFLTKGELLNPTNKSDKVYPFRFIGSKENHLIMVRRLGKKYLVYGSIQPNSNFKGNTAAAENTKIQLDGMSLQFKVRRQGSMYIFDVNGSNPVFYQVDGWHQYEHPYYWSKDMVIEAENADAIPNRVSIISDNGKKGKYDFRTFTTFTQLRQNDYLRFNVRGKSNNSYKCILMIRSVTGQASTIQLESGKHIIRKTISNKDWKQVTLTQTEISQLLGQGPGEVTIKAENGSVDIDWVKF